MDNNLANTADQTTICCDTQNIGDLIISAYWPVLILILACCFRGAISRLLHRDIRVSKDGIEIRNSTQTGTNTKNISETLQNFKATDDASLSFWILQIENTIKINHYDAPGQEHDLKERLIHGLASMTRSRDFEQISNVIFETQIQALRYLSGREKSDKSGMNHFYNLHTERAKEDALTFNNWIGYLISRQLIDVNDNDFCITNVGKQYVEFLNLTQTEQILRANLFRF